MRRIHLAVGLVSLPILVLPIYAEQDDAAEGRRKGEADAKVHVGDTCWLYGNCILTALMSPPFGVLGIAVAYFMEPSPSRWRVANKSPEYQQAYIKAYRASGRKKQVSAARKGCAAGSCVWVGWCCLYIQVDVLPWLDQQSDCLFP